MFELAFLIGIFSYLVFLLGILGILYKNIVVSVTVVFIFFNFLFFLKKVKISGVSFKKIDNLAKFLLLLVIVQALVNLIGALGPEISFDALWYHLTLPKIYLESHRIFHIPGGLLYYSDIPKNIEMLYVAALSFGNEILAKLIHFSFGLLTLFALFKISRKFLNFNLSLLSVIVFYSSLVVGWESIAAYVDLGTAFFTSVSLYCFLNWLERKDNKYLIQVALITGFTIATKTAALNLIPIFCILIFISQFKTLKSKIKIVRDVTFFLFFSVLAALPWFMFSFLNTGNPFYPLFDKNIAIVNKFDFFGVARLFLFAQDPISPFYLLVLPLVIYFFYKYNFKLKILFAFCLLSLLFWYFDSQVGGSRFFLPYMPAFSVLSVSAVGFLQNKNIKNYLWTLLIFIAVLSIGYRFAANFKYLPEVLGRESKAVFLSKNLNFNFGDFYDTNGYFKTRLSGKDRVLLFGFHNLYYVDFPFIDSSFVKSKDKFNLIAVQNGNLPKRFSKWKRIYYNSLTKVSLYSLGGKMWVY